MNKKNNDNYKDYHYSLLMEYQLTFNKAAVLCDQLWVSAMNVTFQCEQGKSQLCVEVVVHLCNVSHAGEFGQQAIYQSHEYQAGITVVFLQNLFTTLGSDVIVLQLNECSKRVFQFKKFLKQLLASPISSSNL